MRDLSLVLACYNETQIFEWSIREIIGVLDASKYDYEVIFVEDKSKDNTPFLIREAISEFQGRPLRAIFHEKNTGRGRAVTDGIYLAEGRVVGYIDVDLEVHARHITDCVGEVLAGADIAVGLRTYPFSLRSAHRFLASKSYVGLVRRLFNVNLHDTESGYKFFNREKILGVLPEVEAQGWFWDTEIMLRSYFAGLKIVQVPVPFVKNHDKRSTVNLPRDTYNYLMNILKFRRTFFRTNRIESSKRNRTCQGC
jgi:glycosyltransferase involved in cell wall biosynthesis